MNDGSGGSPPEQRPFALTNSSALAGDLAGTMLLDTTALVARTGTIEKAGPAGQVPVPPGYRLIDLTGLCIVPVLINAHAHLFAGGKP